MREIESARLAYVRFKKLPVGHVFIIFRYATGEEIAVSPEAEVTDGREFSLLRGFFKTYRLRYFFRKPEAFIRQYRNHGRHVVEQALDLTAPELQHLYRLMQERAAALEATPEWYHSVSNSCVTSILNHFDDVVGRKRALPSVLYIFAPNRLSKMLRRRSEMPASGKVPFSKTRRP